MKGARSLQPHGKSSNFFGKVTTAFGALISSLFLLTFTPVENQTSSTFLVNDAGDPHNIISMSFKENNERINPKERCIFYFYRTNHFGLLEAFSL